MCKLLFALLLAVALPLSAQGNASTTSYVQDTTTGPFGNIIPLGCGSTGIGAEGRSQILIPARYLPGPGATLIGLSAVGNSSSAGSSMVNYQSLRITVARTTATSLSPTFANNLVNPLVVAALNNFTVTWQPNAWVFVPFTTTYLHDGTSSLVIDIQKVVTPLADATHRTVQNANRTDLPRMINALGAFGSGASAAATATATANFPLSLQLQWVGLGAAVVPTLHLRSDAAGFANEFAIGTTFQRVLQGAPGSVAIDLVSTTPFAAPQSLPPVVGQQWLAGPTLEVLVLPGSGVASVPMAIPAAPGLVGLYLGFQSIVAPSPFTQMTFTNFADCFVRA